MKVLIAGNSQASCLKMAHDLHPDILGSLAEIYFYVVPGGLGPVFLIENDHLTIRKGTFNPDFPPYADPPDTVTRPLKDYDAIVVSALGNIGESFLATIPTIWQGLLYDFSPKENTISNRPLSSSCYRQVLHSALAAQYGIQFLTHLRKFYSRKIIVQPFPLISDAAREYPDWRLNKMYDDPVGAYAFFTSTRDAFLKKLCTELSVELLPCPRREWHDKHFTPAEFMHPKDGMHPNGRYGRMVNEQIADAIRSSIQSSSDEPVCPA
jgi:hypothetical protein